MQANTTVKHGWLRAILFLLIYLLITIGVSSMVLVVAVLLFNNTASIHLFYAAVLLNFSTGVLLVMLFRKMIDKETVKSLGLQWKGFGKERTAGFIAAVLMMTLMATVLWLMGLLQWFTIDVEWQGMAYVFVALVLVAFVEELLFRGYVLQNLMHSMRRERALIASAVLFAVFHSMNPNFNLIAFINIFIAGFLLGVNYIYTRNLWFSIFFHFSWNFIQGPVLGFDVSGIELPSLLQQNLRGSILITGGQFGLEASWLTTLTASLACIALYFIFQKKYPVQVAA